MLTLTVFIPICVVSTLFMLRFLFAIEAESRAARVRSKAVAKAILKSRIHRRLEIRRHTPVLRMVEVSSLRRGGKLGHPEYTVREKSSQFKGA